MSAGGRLSLTRRPDQGSDLAVPQSDLDPILPKYPLHLVEHPVDGVQELTADAHVILLLQQEQRRRCGGFHF